MSDLTEQTPSNASVQPVNKKQKVVEIEIKTLTDKQKISIISIVLVLVLQILYLLNLNIFTNFFKGMISGNYQPLADYAGAFLKTFIPYALILFVFFAFYSLYVILIKDEEHIKYLYQVWYYLIVMLFVDFVLFFMSEATSDPYTIELFLALFIIMLSLIITLAPFGIYELLKQRTTQL